MHVAHYWVQFGIHTAWSVPVQLGGWVARLMLPTWRPHEVVCREGHLLHLPLHQTRVRQLADVGGSLALGACCSGYIASLPYLTLGRFFPLSEKVTVDPGLVPYNYVCVCVYVRVCACECVHVRVCVCVRGVVMSPLSKVIVDPGLVSCASARVCALLRPLQVLSQTAIVWF